MKAWVFIKMATFIAKVHFQYSRTEVQKAVKTPGCHFARVQGEQSHDFHDSLRPELGGGGGVSKHGLYLPGIVTHLKSGL